MIVVKPTWDRVRNVVEKSGPNGITNREIARMLGCGYQPVCSLTKAMYEAGEINRDILSGVERPTWRYKAKEGSL